MQRIVGYGRASTDDQKITCMKQEEIVEAAVKARQKMDWEGHYYVGFIADHGVSGSTPFMERPGGQKVMLNVTRGDTIVVSHLDRAFRSLKDCINTVEKMQDLGVNLVILDMQFDTSTPMGLACLRIMAVFKELELSEIRRRTREALAWKADRGLPTNCHAPYGWEKIGKGRDSYYVPCEYERQVAEYLAYMYFARGYTKKEIREHMIRTGFTHSRSAHRNKTVGVNYVERMLSAWIMYKYHGEYPKCYKETRQSAAYRVLKSPFRAVLEYEASQLSPSQPPWVSQAHGTHTSE